MAAGEYLASYTKIPYPHDTLQLHQLLVMSDFRQNITPVEAASYVARGLVYRPKAKVLLKAYIEAFLLCY